MQVQKSPWQKEPCQGAVEKCGVVVQGQELLQMGQIIQGDKDGDRREEDAVTQQLCWTWEVALATPLSM